MGMQNLSLYFPPLEPKQSSLLRAALGKRLNELKHDGFFGKEISVRKTMFDDCNGPKFEELLAIFSTAVLLKAIENDGKDCSMAKKLLVRPTFDQEFSASLLLAYKASFSFKIRDRETLDRRWHKFGRLLLSKEQELDRRTAGTELNFPEISRKRIPKRTLDRLRKHLMENWKGDPEWVDLILRSDQHRPQKALLQRPFIDVWNHACNDTLYAIRPEKNNSLLQSLEHQVQNQRTRLEQLRAIREDLLNKAHTTQPMPQHEMIENVPPAKVQRYGFGPKAAAITATPTAGSSRKRMNSQPLTNAEDPPLEAVRHRSGHNRSQSEAVYTPLSFRRHANNFGRPVANTSARITTPSQTSRPSSRYDVHGDADDFEDTVRETSTCVSFKTSDEDVYSGMGSDYNATQQLPNWERNGHAVDDIVASVLNAQPSPVKYLPSLAERTRMSMAGISQPRPVAQSPELEYARPSQPRFNSADSGPQTPVPLRSLAERTRQSLSAMAFSVKPTENARTTKARLSSAYPANQFQTPMKNIPEAEPTSASAFDGTELDADYETIFKSRPRVAMSPVLKPMEEARESIGSTLQLKNDESYDEDFS